ncbi:hypothetical protein GCM10022240_23700 [Microbacterium kribbense]|uniref:Cytochrome c oxidase assembly protein n=1 Tax=Microbacterium kribbense TaxID=433645 RepID=A0ABP7GNZ8_9MICO
MVAAVSYLWGVHCVARRGGSWPLHRTLMFLGLGLGSYAVIELGFLGAYGGQLRWAFTTRIALLIFVMAPLISLGQPLQLIQQATGPTGAGRVVKVLHTRVVRIFGNAMVGSALVAGIFCLFLTPLGWTLRGAGWIDEGLGLIVGLLGLLLVLPLGALAATQTSLFITVEFLLAFVELVIDSIPGILLRLNGAVLDHAPTIVGTASWWPNPLHDQHLSGDFLWFIAEIGDVPVLLILMFRWMRMDRREAKSYDELSDEDYDAMMQAHLSGAALAAPVESGEHVPTRHAVSSAVRDASRADP